MTPCGCEDGDYRKECWNCSPSGTGVGGGGNCDAGFHWEGGGCIPDTDGGSSGGGESDCPRFYPGGPCASPTSAPAGDPGEEDHGGGGGWPTYGGPTRYNYNPGPVPQFTAPADFVSPGAFEAPQFNAPTLASAQNEPGYAFARDEGLGALQASAAAKGHLRTGGTLKDITAWANRFGEQNYGNVYNRALGTFDRLYQGSVEAYKSKYQGALDEYDRKYRASLAEYAPLLTEWSTNAAGQQHAADLEWQLAWNQYLANIEQWQWMNPSANSLIDLELS